MDQLLQDQVPAGMAIEGRERQHLLERREVAVQVADDHDLVGPVRRDDPARAPGGRPHQLGRAADRRQDFAGSGMVRSVDESRVSGIGLSLDAHFTSSPPARSPSARRAFSSFGLQLAVAVLGADGLDGIAPGGGLAEQVLELDDLLLELADLALDVDRLAVGELSLGLLGRSTGIGRGARVGRCGGAWPRPLSARSFSFWTRCW